MAVKKKAVRKKAPVKKASTKKAAAKRATPKKKAAPVKAAAKAPKVIRDRMTKTQLLNHLAEQTGLTRREVEGVYNALSDAVVASCSKRGAGQITLPGLVKIELKKRPARKKRMGRNPATGEEIMIPAKPASTVLKARVLAGLKNAVL
jgi:nucleoid DNA-binding protein